MRPKDLANNLDASKKVQLPETAQWCLLLHCLDSYEVYQDLRSIETKVVNEVSQWILGERKLITKEEIAWCDGIADEDATEKGGDDVTRRWSKAYAAVTIVVRKLLAKKWKDETFARQLDNRRKETETFIRSVYGSDTDWTLTSVTTNTRYGALERSLSPLEKPNPDENE